MFSLQTIFGQGKQFYALLDEAADAAHASTRALHEMLREPSRVPSLDAFKLARQRERAASDKISQALVESFITPIEREDIEALASALYKIPKQVERFADRYALARHRLEGIDFAPRAAMLEKAAAVVVEMVTELHKLRLEPMKQLNDKLRVIETEADRLILELHRDIYSGRLEAGEMFLLKEFFEILEKAIDRCREAGVVAYEIALKNSYSGTTARMLTFVLVVVFAAFVFEFINGFHDTANSIAASVATKVLSPGQAVILAAVMNLFGALTGTAVAATIATGIVNTAVVDPSMQLMLSALLGAIGWNLFTWWFGLPSSSSHALIGGLCGAALSASHGNWDALIWSQNVGDWTHNKGLIWKVFLPMVTSPVAGFLLGMGMMVFLWAVISAMARAGGPLARLARPRWVNAFFGKVQILSAAYMGYAHGHNDAQKTMGVIALTLFGAEASGALRQLPPWLSFMHPANSAGADVALWIVVSCAMVMAAGTALGGWKIIKTLGHKMVKLHPINGFAVDTSSATILTIAAHFGMPVSTTHSISTAIMGVGFAKNPRALKATVIERIIWAWILTIPAAGSVAFGFYWLLGALGVG